MGMALRRLGGAAPAAAARHAVISGCIFGGRDVHMAVPLLRERYEAALGLEVLSGYLAGPGGGTGDGGGDGEDAAYPSGYLRRTARERALAGAGA